MGFSCGIVGLPNAGKSTLFNALTRTGAAQAANYPFCTIEPNAGEVAVADPRLEELARIAGSAQIIPARLRFIDIAGLVRGAAEGEGLGSRFLGHIRECDALAHIVRCFESEEVSHIEGRIDPAADVEIVETELMLADLESLERRLPGAEKRAKRGGREEAEAFRRMSAARAALARGAAGDMREFGDLGLLTAKPVLYVCNVGEADAGGGNLHARRIAQLAQARGARCLVIAAGLEEALAGVSAGERAAYLEGCGVEAPGLERLISAGYGLLGLMTFFTAGPKEARAWTLRRGSSAQTAAGRIHGDFARGFICAETAGFADFVASGGEAGARAAGKLRAEGRDYKVRDGDVIHFRFNL